MDIRHDLCLEHGVLCIHISANFLLYHRKIIWLVIYFHLFPFLKLDSYVTLMFACWVTGRIVVHLLYNKIFHKSNNTFFSLIWSWRFYPSLKRCSSLCWTLGGALHLSRGIMLLCGDDVFLWLKRRSELHHGKTTHAHSELWSAPAGRLRSCQSLNMTIIDGSCTRRPLWS